MTLFAFDYGQSEKLQFFVDAEWIPVINSNYTIGLDGISLPLYFLSMAVTFLVMIYTWDNMPDAGNPKAFYMLMLVLQTGMAGTFIAQDLILFFVFFEVVLLPQVYNAQRFRCDLSPFPSIMAIHDACMELDAFRDAAPESQPDAE